MKAQIKITDEKIAGGLTMEPNSLQNQWQAKLHDPVQELTTMIVKRSFLVFNHNKYVAVPVENIALFHSRNACSSIVCMDQRTFPIHYSLDQIQNLLTVNQFFRVNRQYLINFAAIKEVEHYFARKLLVNLIVGTQDKLVVPKERTRLFFRWLENG